MRGGGEREARGMMDCRISAARIAALGAALTLFAFTGAGAQAPDHITVGCTLVDDSSPVLYAQQAGLFRQAGLDVTIQPTASGAAASAAIIGGTLQFGNSSVMTPIEAHEKGVPLVIAAPGQLYTGEDFSDAVVKAGSPIKTGRDLNGTTIATVSVTDLNFISIEAWIDQHGGDVHTIKNIELPYAAMVPALTDGRISAGVMIEPLLTQAVGTGKVQRLANLYRVFGNRFVPTAWLTNATWAAANPDIVRRFNRVIRQAAIYANAHHDETAALQSKYAGVELQTVLRSVRAVFDEQPIKPADLQPLIDAASKYGVIHTHFDAKDLISPVIL